MLFQEVHLSGQAQLALYRAHGDIYKQKITVKKTSGDKSGIWHVGKLLTENDIATLLILFYVIAYCGNLTLSVFFRIFFDFWNIIYILFLKGPYQEFEAILPDDSPELKFGIVVYETGVMMAEQTLTVTGITLANEGSLRGVEDLVIGPNGKFIIRYTV